MGEMTRVLITGATGFIGQRCVVEARKNGLDVVAIARGATPDDWQNDSGISVVKADLALAEAVPVLAKAVATCGAVIHAAAHLGGDAQAVQRDTLAGTETVLASMEGSKARLVLVSSIVVYDTDKLSPGQAVTESSPMASTESARDAYTAGKVQQELLCLARREDLWMMRPGAVYGPGRSWHALMGAWAGPLHIQINSDGELPLCHVDLVAWALVRAAMTDPSGQRGVNILDDDRPTRQRFLKVHRAIAGWPKIVFPTPWKFWLILSKLLAPLQDKLPGLLQERIIRARVMPLLWPNIGLHSALGAPTPISFDDNIKNAIKEGVQ